MLLGFAKVVFWIYYHVFYRLRVEGLENIPKDGGVILCANHLSFHDPILLCLLSKRIVHMLGKKELFKNKFVAALLKKLYAIPVDREKTDMTAYRSVLKVLEDGGAVGIFSQGTRTKEFDAKEAKAGVALFAMKGNANVVPVFIDANYKLFSRIHIRFGKVLTFDEYRGQRVKSEQLAEVADIVMDAIVALAPEGKKA